MSAVATTGEVESFNTANCGLKAHLNIFSSVFLMDLLTILTVLNNDSLILE